MTKTNSRFNRGFTLIELLVVIVIISILSTLLMVNFIGVRQRGRDAQRKSDMRQWQTALELYRSDNGTYPSAITVACGATWNPGGVTYVQKVPCDPLGSNSTFNSGAYFYYSPSGNLTYSVAACLENANEDPTKDFNITTTPPTGAADTCSTHRYYTVNNP